MERKNKITLFIISVVISIIILIFFVTGYYSVDTERIYSQGYIDYATKDAYIRDGRWVSAILFVIIGLINPSIKTMYIINILIAIVILSFCVLQIYDMIGKCKRLNKRKSKIIAFMLSYTYIFNFLIVDVLKFIDSFIISLSILIFIIAIKKIIFENKRKVGMLLTIFGVICYQGTIPVYIATAILVTLLENKKINKNYFKKILPCAVSIIIASILNIVLVNIVPIITDMEKTDRLQNIDYLNNIKKNLLELSNILFYSFNMFPPYIWITLGIGLITISIVYGIKKNKLEMAIYILMLFMAYMGSILVILPLQNYAVSPRVILPIGQTISAICIYIYCTNFKEQKMDIYEKTVFCICCLYFFITIFSIFKSNYEYKMGNKLDEAFAKKLEDEIVRLEEQGISINKVGIKYTGNGQNIKRYGKLIREQSLYIQGLYTTSLNKFYTGRTISKVQDFTDELEKKYFKNPSEKEVQFKNINDVLYVLIDL